MTGVILVLPCLQATFRGVKWARNALGWVLGVGGCEHFSLLPDNWSKCDF
jgi:hypothetical protein